MRQHELTSYVLENPTFEVRYPESFLHFDNSGKIWERVRAKWPNTEIEKAEPQQTSFILDHRYRLTVLLDKCSVGEIRPQHGHLTDMSEVAEGFLGIVTENLQISQYTRVGLRIVFGKKCNTIEEAAMSITQSNILNIPGGPHFAVNVKHVYPELVLRMEDDNNGATVRLRIEERAMNLIPPGTWLETPPIDVKKSCLVYDIDYYTRKAVKVGQLKVKEWIGQVFHLIKRDSGPFLGVVNEQA